MEAVGSEEEQAARTLGAGPWQTFWYVTLPNIKWGLLYGVLLCSARALGEFGAASVVSGRQTGVTDTLPIRVQKLHEDLGPDANAMAFSVAALLAGLALVTLAVKGVLERKKREATQGDHNASSPSALGGEGLGERGRAKGRAEEGGETPPLPDTVGVGSPRPAPATPSPSPPAPLPRGQRGVVDGGGL
jgi:ABC-type Fe3+ transport system permease subunit